jgi:pyruvate/2-oxoglutarate dehydrogenase complex dihydrolipoamide acyltransferase (E2) component
LPISISFDHRAVTGAEAAQFMQCLIEMLLGRKIVR